MTARHTPASPPTVFQAAAGDDTLLDLHCLAFAGGSVAELPPVGRRPAGGHRAHRAGTAWGGTYARTIRRRGLSCLLDELVDRIASRPPGRWRSSATAWARSSPSN
ncbi:MAG: hypothetical protein HPM95_15950 [Alphaproteobacteria bacterium]|nr:hypothetical protein [Alphaproteobacteria bacterium]